MSTHETVLPITPGQLKELSAALVLAVPLDMSSETAQAWIGQKGRLQDILRRGPGLVCQTHSTSISFLLKDWQLFYRKFFGLDVDFSNVRIPDRRPGFDRLIVAAQGLTLNRVYEVMQSSFACKKYADDLDSAIQNDHNPATKHYAIWVHDGQEGEEEIKNRSGNDFQRRNVKGMTLLEGMVFGLKYWSETGKHLDVNNITLCLGSRGRCGGVPFVSWSRSSDKVSVDCYSPGSDGPLRSREVVSF